MNLKTIARFISEPIYQRIGFMEFYKVNLENKDGIFKCSFGKKIFQDYSKEKVICLVEGKKGHWGFVCKKVKFLNNNEELTTWENIAPKEKINSETPSKQVRNLLSNDEIFDLLTKQLKLTPQQKGWETFFFCPFHSEPEAAKLTFDLKAKEFTCSSVDEDQHKKIGDIFDLWTKYKQISLAETLEEISQLGYLPSLVLKKRKETPKNIIKKVETEQAIGEVELNFEQQKICKIVLAGKNICFLGEAGTGKSFLLNYLISILKEKRANELFITSYTGRTAVNIQGQTLHSFAGIGATQRFSWQQLLTKISKKKEAVNRWKKCKVLIIDEISMLSGDLFDNLEIIARQIKGNDRSFGGIQLVMCGDFYQLPPTEKKYKWCFESDAWDKCISEVVHLRQIYRQTDNQLINLLQEVRNNCLSSNSLALLNSLKEEPQWPKDGIEPTQLYSTNEEVNQINAQELAKLSTFLITYHAKDVEYQAKTLNILTKDCLVPDKLELKIGAQVMLTINQFERKLVNGSQGVIINFKNEGGKKYPIVRFFNNKIAVVKPFEYKLLGHKNNEEVVLASRQQIPLILSWAITIHKSQGQTIERLKIDCDKIWAEGQLYVALSRATNLKYLQVINFRQEKIKICQRVKKYCERFSKIIEKNN